MVSCLVIALFAGCQPALDQIVGPSASGLKIALSALTGGDGGLRADGASQATIRVEVFRKDGEMITGAIVTLTSTLGKLGSASLTTANGVAVTTLTSGTTPGTAYIVATVENISATAAVQIVKF